VNRKHTSAGQGWRPYEPTLRDIRRACERIQAGWSERERDKRAGRLRAVTWVPPSVDWSALTEAANEDQKTSQSPVGIEVDV